MNGGMHSRRTLSFLSLVPQQLLGLTSTNLPYIRQHSLLSLCRGNMMHAGAVLSSQDFHE